MMKAKILQVKMTSKKGLACLLAVLMLLTALPLGLVTSAMAATKDCMVVEVQGKKVYFFGAEALEVTGSKVAYTAESAEVPTIYVDGAVDPADDVQISDGVIDFGTWLADQSAWVGVLCDPDGTVTGTEPSVQPDAQAPRVTVSGNPTAWGKAPAILTVQADDGNGYGAVAYRMDNGQWQKAPEFRVKANGTYTFYAKDAVGNVSTGETVEVQYVDATAPEIGVVLDPPNAGEQWTNGKVKVTVTGKDSESGLAEKAFKMDEGQWQETGTFVIQDNKEHNFYVRDAVGNEAKQQAKADKYDNIAPVIQKVQVKLGNLVLKQGTYISDQITYTYHIDATDNEGGSGIKVFSCNGGETWQASGDFKLKGGESYDFCVKDQAENESAVLVYTPNYDTTAPTINDVQQSTDKPTNQAVTVTVTANDVQSGLNKFGAYKLDNGDWQKENSFDIQDDKIHTVSVRDNANPENVAEKKIQVKNFNSTPPTVTNVTLSNVGADGKENWTNEPITATVEAKGNTNNAQVEFPVVAYKMDDGDWQYIEKNETANQFTIEDKKEHKFYCLDNAGNASEASSCAAKLYDKKAPELEPKKTPEFYPVEFSQSNNGPFAKFLNKLSFGRFFNKELKITVHATDGVDACSNASGFSEDKAQSLIFKNTSGEVVQTIPIKHAATAEEVGDSVITEFNATIDDVKLSNFKGSLYVQLQDQLGNQTEEIQVTTANSNLGELKNTEEFGDCNFVLENNAPRILAAGQNAELKAENAVSASPSTTTFKNDYTVSFHVSDQTESGEISGVAGVQVNVNGTDVYSEQYNNEKKPQTGTIDLHAVAKADKEENAYQVNGEKIKNWNGGELTYTVEAWDNAGNASKVSFTLNFDQTAPTVQFAIPNEKSCKKVSVTDYGFFFNKDTDVVISASDPCNREQNEATASGVKSITYKLVPFNQEFDEVEAIPVDDSSVTVAVQAGFKGQIYAYATDNAGNFPGTREDGKWSGCKYFADSSKANDQGYVHPDGTIVENAQQHQDSSIVIARKNQPAGTQNNKKAYKAGGQNAPQQDKKLSYDATKNVPLYDTNAKFTVTVKDAQSGIRTVKYTLIEGGKTSVNTLEVNTPYGKADAQAALQAENLESSTGNATRHAKELWRVDDAKITGRDANLATELTSTVTVDANYNDILLIVELTDNAGNTSYDYVAFGIDKTAPQIQVEYTSAVAPQSGSYYSKTRTAHITITERNIRTEQVALLIEKCLDSARTFDKKDTKAYREGFKITGKTLLQKGSGNGDNRQYQIKVDFTGDGNYRIKTLKCTDNVGHANTAVTYGKYNAAGNRDAVSGSNKTRFTIDKTAPKIHVALNLNDRVKNKKYFNATRTATVTVTEHNFNAKAFENQLKATLNGKGIAVPSVSAFRQENGTDRWTATVTFVADGDYVLNFKTTDKAGNSYKTVAGDFSGAAAQNFTIDKTAPQLTIGGITTNTAYKKVPTIVVKEADNNASTITSSVVGTCFDSQSKMAKRTVKVSAKNSGQLTADHQLQNTVTYTAVEQDGYYIVTAQCVDMAGNQSQVQRKVFTKNEKGAVYVVSDDLAALNNGYANKTAVAKQSLVVTEYSPTEIQSPEYYININGKKKDGLVTMEKGQHHAGEWYVNTYTISSKDILAEGKYALYIKSTTKLDGKNTVVNNSSENKDLHRLNIQFTIDNTNPYVRITGLEKHLYSNTKVQTVTFSVSESNLASIVIHMTRDGQALDPLVWDHAQDKKHPNGWTVENGIAVVQVQLENGKSDLTFEITDLAGNKCSTANDYNKQELFVSGTTGNKNNWLEEKDGKIVLKDIYVDKGFSANAFAALIRNNLAISVVIFVVIGLVLLAVIILPILSKKRKKMDAADAEKLN
ncbi:MAG: hypothetical protein UF405_03920 [Acutalibacteraceae bacterium]|nr:hypothetical protein [Acutalibacteraceae bacterium]